MKPIVLFVPYYGTVPPYISAFLHTVSKQASFLDVCLFSDRSFLEEITMSCVIPSNVRLIELSWDNLCSLILKKKFPKPFFPYKLCDYKVAYGYIFEEYTDNYEFWGYCDVDILMGDVCSFLERNNFRQYDRIGSWGHFTIYKNNDRTRTYFLESFKGQKLNDKFSYACTTTYPCNIDEYGSNILFTKLFGKKMFLEDNFVLNTAIGCKGCHTWQHRFSPQILTWEDGRTFSYSLDDNKQIVKEEGMYIHFMMQKNVQSSFPLSESLLLTPEKVIPFNPSLIDCYLTNEGAPETTESYQLGLQSYAKFLRRQRRDRLIREIRTVGFWSALRNIFLRIGAIEQLLDHKLF